MEENMMKIKSLILANEIDRKVRELVNTSNPNVDEVLGDVRNQLAELCEMAVKYEIIKEVHLKNLSEMIDKAEEL